MSIRVPYETVKSTVTQAFLNLGLSQEKAEKCAEIHTESSLEGIESHGLNRVPRFAEYVQKGWVDINAEPELVGLSLVTTLVIMAVTSNIILSLGMVGALSIVRFRAAIKEPIEIVYLFWSIASGIVVGAGLLPLALIGSAIIGLILWIFASRKTHQSPYMLILRLTDEAGEAAAMQLVKTSADKAIVKAKTVTPGNIELSCEVRLKDASTAFINRLSEINGVESAALVSYNGEYMS